MEQYVIVGNTTQPLSEHEKEMQFLREVFNPFNFMSRPLKEPQPIVNHNPVSLNYEKP